MPFMILALGFAVILGIRSPASAIRGILRMLLVPILLLLVWRFVVGEWHHLHWYYQVGLVSATAIAIPIWLLVGTYFGRQVLIHAVANFLYDVVRNLVALPSRLIRLLVQRGA